MGKTRIAPERYRAARASRAEDGACEGTGARAVPSTGWETQPEAGRRMGCGGTERFAIRPARAARRRERRLAAAFVALAVAIALAALLLAPVVGVLGSLAGGAAGEATAPEASTPIDQWRLGEVPALYQTDPAWAGQPYAGGTIGENGCGPTCLAMAYIALTGNRDRGPVEMAELSERLGCTVDGMTAWSFMVDGASALGLSSEELSADPEAVRAALGAGKVVICSVLPGDFTTTGHFIVLAGLNADGTVAVRDPNSAERTARSWDLQRVIDQCANLWAVGA